MRERWLRQLDAERSALVRSVERYLHQMADAKARGSAAELPPGRGKVLEWFTPLVEAIRAEQEAVRGPACSTSLAAGTWLEPGAAFPAVLMASGHRAVSTELYSGIAHAAWCGLYQALRRSVCSF